MCNNSKVKRSYYYADCDEFLNASEEAILGELTDSHMPLTLTVQQEQAWKEEIRIDSIPSVDGFHARLRRDCMKSWMFTFNSLLFHKLALTEVNYVARLTNLPFSVSVVGNDLRCASKCDRAL